MKCLFFLYGEYRTFPTAVKTWNILDIPDLDIVIHTPTTSSDFRFSTDYKNIKENDFNILNNSKIFFYDRDDYKKDFNASVHFSYNFLYNYLIETDEIYDYVFIGRLDSEFYLKNYKKFLSKNRSELFAIAKPFISEETSFIPDHIFFGSSNIIKKFLKDLPTPSARLGSHSEIAEYVYYNFKCETWENFDSIHIRPNMVNIFENYFKNSNKIQNIDLEYENFLKNIFFPNHIRLEEEYYRNYRDDI